MYKSIAGLVCLGAAFIVPTCLFYPVAAYTPLEQLDHAATGAMFFCLVIECGFLAAAWSLIPVKE